MANFVLVVKNEVYRADIRVKVLDFVAHANELAAAFVFPLPPAHAQLSVFNPPLARITAAAVVAVHRAVVFELERRRSARKACSQLFGVQRITPARAEIDAPREVGVARMRRRRPKPVCWRSWKGRRVYRRVAAAFVGNAGQLFMLGSRQATPVLLAWVLACLPKLGASTHPLTTLDRQPEWAL